MKQRIGLALPPELLARVDAARGDVSRTRFIERALEGQIEAVAMMQRARALLPDLTVSDPTDVPNPHPGDTPGVVPAQTVRTSPYDPKAGVRPIPKL